MTEPPQPDETESSQNGSGGSVAIARPPARAGALRSGLQRAFSFPVMLATLLALLAFITVRGRFDDPDVWWHLKMGEIIWTTHTIPLHDIFSYTTNHHAVVPQEWLGEVTIYLAYKLGGYSAMMLWLCLFTSAIYAASYALCSLYSGNLKVALVGGIITWLFSTIGLSIRPQMIGYFLLVAELILIHLGRTRSPRWFLGLPVLFALWINCHGSFFLGLVIAGIVLFSSFFHFQIGSLQAPQWEPARRKTLIIGLILVVPALFINPDGLHQVIYPLNTMLHQNLQMSSVQEWQPIPMTDLRAKALMLILLGSFLTVLFRRSELYFDELLLLAAATWLGLSHRRTLFAFGIMVAPIFCRQIAGLWDNYERDKDLHWVNAVFMAASVAMMVYFFPSPQNLRAQIASFSPVKAVQYIKSHHLAGPMLNAYADGGYLIWEAPEYPTFIDGRGDPFEETGVLLAYGQWATLQTSPRPLLQKYKINFCLMAKDAPVDQVLNLLPEWKKVYADNNSVIYLRQ